ncbi:MAG: carbohydrate kinase [Acidimicrobiaceae bacterium]|nr:carbohydrate kinase [Acidimicrobiaceae bacterium]
MIFSCGEALVDVVPDPVPGGGPMNVAIAAARLGAPSAFVGGVSTDHFGQMLWSHLEANSVDVSLCQRFDAPTARAIVEHVPELRFRFEGEGTADTLLADLDVSKVSGRANIVHGGTLGLFRRRTAETLAELAESHDGLVSLDPNIRPRVIDDRDVWNNFHDRWLPHVDIYKGSDEDLEWIWPDRTPEQSAEWLLAQGVRAVIVTRGSDGLSVLTLSSESRAVPPPVDVVDTVGAGDTIVGTVLTSINERFEGDEIDLGELNAADWQTFAERAVAAAAITCSRAGADVPYRHELDW